MTLPASAQSTERALADLLRAQPPDRLAAMARRFASACAADGLYVHRASEGRDVPIPAVLSPVVVPRALLREMSRGARSLAGALATLTGPVLAGATAVPKEKLFGGFNALERECLERAWPAASRLVTLRADYFLDPSGRPRALELNTTIPAMQGYSDIVAEQSIRALAGLRGLPAERVEALVARAARNTRELLASLVAQAGGAERARRIAIVSRRGDAQVGELLRHERKWCEAGHDARHVYADEVRLVGDAAGRAPLAVVARGERFDVVYRHVFLRRLDPASDLARGCLTPERVPMWNPPCGQLEAKGMLALLAQIAADEGRARAAGLTEEQVDAARRLLPWTRPLVPGATVGPDGERVPDLVMYVRAARERVVLKKSWDYGGHGVFLGRDAGPEGESLPRIAALLGRPAATWDDLVDHALADGDLWIVQELVPAPTRRMLLARADADPEWRDLYVDVSAYANLGAPGDGEAGPSGGAVRAAPNRIVNIVGGGGVAPLLTDDLATDLLGG